MSTAPVIDPVHDLDPEAMEILADPEVRESWEALDDPEDREDLLESMRVMRRIEKGKEETVSWEAVKTESGL